MIADPGHRQVGKNVAIAAQAIDLDAALCRGDKCSMRLADAFRFAGGARGVQHHRDIVEMTEFDFGIEKVRMIAVVYPPHLHQFMDSVQEGLVVMPHAARVVIKDVLERAGLLLDFEQFVDLLLILDDGETDAGILQRKKHFARDGILIERHRHAAQTLRRAHHHVQMRPVVADHR
ncbi:MAG: hypothetical protein ACD_10C00137G0001 [uncultured bacterium]|nr:MAG: hypothetical protein ACD_10C00137G0001 [uncultured bacterium]